MRKIDLNIKLIDFNGQEIEKSDTINKILAGFLLRQTKGDPIKYFDWAMKLGKDGILEADQSDIDKLKELIDKSEELTVLVKAPLIKALKEVNN